MREYFKRPNDNAEVFTDGWLRTGDLARRDQDGYLYFVDRLKDMIISGGLNIYSRVVEDALESHPAISEAAVIGVPDTAFGEAVMAFVICKPSNERPTTDELKVHCADRIAGYKKPKFIQFVDRLPRNNTGKIAKVELRALSATH
jgi:long-chain acyl-CoA synthetase